MRADHAGNADLRRHLRLELLGSGAVGHRADPHPVKHAVVGAHLFDEGAEALLPHGVRAMLNPCADCVQIQARDVNIAHFVKHSAAYDVLHLAQHRLAVIVKHVDPREAERCSRLRKAFQHATDQRLLGGGHAVERNAPAAFEIADQAVFCRAQDSRGRDVLLFENEWSIRLACENNEGLELAETANRL